MWAKLSGGPERVPRVGVLGDEPERDLLAAPTDQDRQVTDRRRVELREPVLHPGQVIAELAQAAAGGTELIAVLCVVAFEPTGTDAEVHPAARHVIESARHVDQQLGVPIAVTGHEHAEVRPARVGGHHRQQRPPLEMVGVGLAVQREEVIPRPDRVGAHPVAGAPRPAQLVNRRRLGMQLDSDA